MSEYWLTRPMERKSWAVWNITETVSEQDMEAFLKISLSVKYAINIKDASSYELNTIAYFDELERLMQTMESRGIFLYEGNLC